MNAASFLKKMAKNQLTFHWFFIGIQFALVPSHILALILYNIRIIFDMWQVNASDREVHACMCRIVRKRNSEEKITTHTCTTWPGP